jgi:hypothetical protein
MKSKTSLTQSEDLAASIDRLAGAKMSLEKSRLTDYVGELASDKLRELDSAQFIALVLPTGARPPG